MFERDVWVETGDGRWRLEHRRRSPGRGTLIWALGVPVLLAVAAVAARGSIHPSPDGVGAPPTPSPSGGAIGLVFVPLLVLWTGAIATSRATSRAAWLAIGGAALLVVPVCGLVLYEAATPGCGEPRRAIVEPFPPGVEVIGEQMSGPISGPENWRRIQLMTFDERDLVDQLVSLYRRRGWPLETIGYAPGAFMPYGPEWRLEVRSIPAPAGQSGAAVTLSHTPDDSRGCHNW